MGATMQFVSVEGAGFKSIDAPVTFSFDRKPGLYHITGRNESNPRLGANGVGKSTLLDLVFWVFYGYTSRKLKAGNVHTWGSKQKTYGVVTLRREGALIALKRTWSPNGLFMRVGTGDWKEIDDEAVLKLINLTPTAFLNSVYISQFSTMFFDMSHQDQAALFSNVLQLDSWIERSRAASKAAGDLTKELQVLEGEYSKTEGILETMLKSLDDYAASLEEAEQARDAELERLQHDLDRATKARDGAAADLKAVACQLSHSEDFYNSTQDVLTGYMAKYRDLQREVEDGNYQFNRLVKEETALLKESNKGRYATQCPHCGQTMDRDAQRKAHRHLQGKLSEVKAELETLDPQLNQMENDLDRMEPDLDKLEAEVKALKGKVHQYKREHDDITRALRTHEHEVRMLQQQIDSHTWAIGRVADMADKAELDTIPVKAQLVDLQEKLLAKSRECERVKYWIKGFKEVRLFIIEQALTDLEIEVNSVLDSLGLSGWSVRFEVERETTAKTVKRAFDVLVTSPDNKKPVPWEAWSGGEATRLRVAGTAGLSNLILSACGEDSNIEIWDEPSSHLSGEGIDDLVQLLHRRAMDTGKQIYLIDHHAFSFGSFAAVITVVKDQDGTYIEETNQ